MSKLGYTFYPKDFNSDRVGELSFSARAVYRELIDKAMLSDNSILLLMNGWARRWNCDVEIIKSALSELKLIGLIEYKDEKNISLPECQRRIDKAKTSRANGANGGRPKKGEKPKKNPEETQNKPSDNPEKTQPKPERKRSISIKERESKFKEKVMGYSEKYPAAMLDKFFGYWSEHGEGDKKMRYEKQESFGISRRLATWYSRGLKSGEISPRKPKQVVSKDWTVDDLKAESRTKVRMLYQKGVITKQQLEASI